MGEKEARVKNIKWSSFLSLRSSSKAMLLEKLATFVRNRNTENL